MTIRLTCRDCTDADFDGIDEIPEGWSDVEEVQGLEESYDDPDSDWFTHLGTYPECQAAAELRRAQQRLRYREMLRVQKKHRDRIYDLLREDPEALEAFDRWLEIFENRLNVARTRQDGLRRPVGRKDLRAPTDAPVASWRHSRRCRSERCEEASIRRSRGSGRGCPMSGSRAVGD